MTPWRRRNSSKENIKKNEVKEKDTKKDIKQVSDNKSGDNANIQCPKCKKGIIMQGKTAFGCNAYKEGCDFKIAFEQYGKKLTDKQIISLIEKGKSAKIKGFVKDEIKVNGSLVLRSDFTLDLQVEQEKNAESLKLTANNSLLICPICNIGTILKGNKAYGCSRYKEGCHFVIPFSELLQKYNSTELTKEIISSQTTN